MARARRSQIQRYSPLADRRIKLGVSQKALADAVGVSLKTIERLEAGRIRDPGIRLLNNCALALGGKLEHIIHPAWREWLDSDGEHPFPPDPDTFLHQQRLAIPLKIEQHLLGED